MPNTRRRRFSVHNNIAGRPPTKVQNAQPSHTDTDNEIKVNSLVVSKPSKSKNKISSNTSKHPPILETGAKSESDTKVSPVCKYSQSTEERMEREILTESKNKYLETTPSTADGSSVDQVKVSTTEPFEKEEPRPMRERTPLRRDRYPRQHRVKVRSPKRRIGMQDQGKSSDVTTNFSNVQSTGTCAINWEDELEVYSCENFTSAIENIDDDDRQSNHSIDDMCRICHGGEGLSSEVGCLISACLCRGTVGRVHVKCLERWLTESGKSRCELCGTRYATRRVHRYGVPRALIMWILSQNAKQLMVDSLGIMLMSPLAVLAAWLSGRTLAGLMTQENHVTPWPLASTFVLACMTLVCYYCWIVSAATRHALGWWIWYRSQYEVRLQLQDNEE